MSHADTHLIAPVLKDWATARDLVFPLKFKVIETFREELSNQSMASEDIFEAF